MNFKKSKIRSLVLLALAAVAFCGLIWFANKDRPVYRSSNMAGTDYEVGRVLRVVEDHKTVDEEMDGIWRGSMTLEVEILTGRYKGDTAIVENYFSSLYNVRVAEGDKISIRIDTTGEDEYQVSVYNYYRVPQMIGCIVAFVLLLVLIGGKKGVKSVAGLAFTVVCILWILLPLALKGYSPLAVTILLILVCNFVSFFLIDGISTKTVVAAIGSMLGVLAGAVFALIAQNAMSITTYQMDEAETLLLITSTTELKIRDLFLCGILISCMGAVMDVAMSICSAVAEIHQVDRSLGMAKLFASGMNIGRDAMGTMANTLILAVAGTSLNMMLMIYSYDVSFQQLMNTDFVAIEIIQCIAGSVGIVCTVPLVALLSAAVFGKKTKK
mgnify:CR=1 FL=1